MKQNVGTINALIRITCGLTMLAWSISKFSLRPYRESYVVVMLLAAMKVAEGIVRFCPVTALIENQLDSGKQKQTMRNNQEAAVQQ